MEMADIDKVISGLNRCKDMNKINCDKCPYDYNGRGNGKSECTAELSADALELLKEYKKHLQNDLENLNKKKLQMENKINCITQTERLCRYSKDNNRLPNRYDCNPLGCDACSYYRVGT